MFNPDCSQKEIRHGVIGDAESFYKTHIHTAKKYGHIQHYTAKYSTYYTHQTKTMQSLHYSRSYIALPVTQKQPPLLARQLQNPLLQPARDISSENVLKNAL